MKKTKSAYCFISAVFILSLDLPAAGAFAQDDSTKFVPSSAMAAIFVKPKEALAQPGMELIPYEVITAFGEREVGFDPCEITQITALVDSFSDTVEPPGFGVMIQFATAQKVSESLLEKLQLQAESKNGKTIYRGQSGYGEALFAYDDKTFFLGQESFIEKMLAARGAKSALIDRISESPPSGHFDVYATIEPIRGLMKTQLPPADQVPPPFANLLKLPDLVDSITLNNSLAADGINRLQIKAVDEEGAKEIRKIVRRGIATAKQVLMAQMASEMDGQDPLLQQSLRTYMNRIGDYFQQQIEPVVEGDRLVMDFSTGQSAQMSNMATIGVLVGMLLPAVQATREAARRTMASSQLRQFALAALNYESAYQKFPAQANYDDDGNPLLSWRVHVLPFLEEEELHRQFHLDEPWDSPHNIKLLDRMPVIYAGPNSIHKNKTVFLGISGPGTMFDGSTPTKIGAVSDGTSNTLMFVETNDAAAVPWTKPADYQFDQEDPLWGVLGTRPGGFNASFVDGSVRFLSESLPREAVNALMLKADGNVGQR